MKPGKIVLLPFPFADANFRKVRPALIIGKTADRYHDLIVCAISSSIPDHLTKADIIVLQTPSNQLRVESCIKTDSIAKIRETQIVHELGDAIYFTGENSITSGRFNPIINWKWYVDGQLMIQGPYDIYYGQTFTAPINQYKTYTIKLRIEDAAGDWNEISYYLQVNPNKEIFYYVKDHLGSVRSTINGNGDVVSRDDYYPFGEPMNGRSFNSANPSNSIRFTSHQLDEDFDLDLTYAGARYLDTEIGVWMSRDPLRGKFPRWSPYNYTINNPLIFIDPDGRDVWGVIKGVGTVLAGVAQVGVGTYYSAQTGGVGFALGGATLITSGTITSGLGIGQIAVEAKDTYDQLFVGESGSLNKPEIPSGTAELLGLASDKANITEGAQTIGSKIDSGVNIIVGAMSVSAGKNVVEGFQNIYKSGKNILKNGATNSREVAISNAVVVDNIENVVEGVGIYLETQNIIDQTKKKE